MTDGGWNPWKMTAIGMGLVMTTALVTGLVVANWSGTDADTKVVASPGERLKPASRAVSGSTAVRAARATAAPPGPVAQSTPAAPPTTPPSPATIEACNRQAGAMTTQDKTVEVVKDAAIGTVVGAAVGAAGGAIADGGKGAGKGAAIGGVIGAGGGTLYGLNENRKSDERYRVAYGECMRSRGYPG